jgi:aminoglycoside phosphotransferase (APT) family kinase protein
MPDDTISVRPDERFDGARLQAWLRDKLPGADHPLTVRQFTGGVANLTYLLDFGEHQYVLRRPPLGPVAKHAHDMAREYKGLSALYRVFPKAPRAWLFCEDVEVIGSQFLIVERRQGVVVRKFIPPEFADFPDAPQRMSRALIETLAEFHAVDYDALGLGDLGRPEGFISRQIEGWRKRWLAAKTEDLPIMEEVYAWLKANQPPSPPPTLVHNDYKLDNVMFAPDDPGQIIAVFDWDMCTLGDPFSDLGALLTYWTEPGDAPYMQAIAQMPVGDARFWTRAHLVERYAELSGRDISDVHFYHALGLFRLTVIAAQIYIRYARGQTQDQRFAGLGALIPLIARAAKDAATRA